MNQQNKACLRRMGLLLMEKRMYDYDADSIHYEGETLKSRTLFDCLRPHPSLLKAACS